MDTEKAMGSQARGVRKAGYSRVQACFGFPSKAAAHQANHSMHRPPGTGGTRPLLAASAATAASRAARMMGQTSAALATTCGHSREE